MVVERKHGSVIRSILGTTLLTIEYSLAEDSDNSKKGVHMVLFKHQIKPLEFLAKKYNKDGIGPYLRDEGIPKLLRVEREKLAMEGVILE